MTRMILAITTGRADWGLIRPVANALSRSKAHVEILPVGRHDLGDWARLSLPSLNVHFTDDSPLGIAQALGMAVMGFAAAYDREKPDILLVAGDRYEAHAAVAAALPFRIPVAHIHGGELTIGAYDNQYRNAITKMAHIHFVAHENARAGLEDIGEDPEHIYVVGSPLLDDLEYDVPGQQAEAIVVVHPATLESGSMAAVIEALFGAVAQEINGKVLVIHPGEDVRSRHIFVSPIYREFQLRSDWEFYDSLPRRQYLGYLATAKVLVGNSSSGIIEAPSFKLPVINVGSRQKGRLQASNVINVSPGKDHIAAGIRQALNDPIWRAQCADAVNPYGDGHASETIVDGLLGLNLQDENLLKKGVI